jgi:hypothetical protein
MKQSADIALQKPSRSLPSDNGAPTTAGAPIVFAYFTAALPPSA